ncbi:MAG: hypothetical protein Ct9H300mP1_15060 [Planctomycetaceae bacterium]|nr:MAG: hypothetical protein Ct9H300mP1_15060 [Planctomycetaceae bacterium]
MEYLIPSEWFQDLPEWGLLGLVILSMFTLMTGADWLVESASALARRLGFRKSCGSNNCQPGNDCSGVCCQRDGSVGWQEGFGPLGKPWDRSLPTPG